MIDIDKKRLFNLSIWNIICIMLCVAAAQFSTELAIDAQISQTGRTVIWFVSWIGTWIILELARYIFRKLKTKNK